jgi:predicted dinucleotide-binding enzyme
MRLGIIGAGSLGSAVGERFAAGGHEVMFGGLESARESATRLGISAGSNAEAASFGEVVVLAVPFAAIDAALSEAGCTGGSCGRA